MTNDGKRSGEITAAELMAQLEQDEDWVRKRAALDEEYQARADALSRAEQPIVRDLNAAGFKVSSVWDLVNTSEPYPDALPVLLDHLRRGGYPDGVMESLGSALAVRPAVYAWDIFRDLYLSATGRGEEEGLAVALAASATEDHFDDLVALLNAESRGSTRIHFLRAIKQVGGTRGRGVLESLRSDPMFGQEARALLKS